MTPRLLLVGNFLSTTGLHRHYSEDLADRLELRDWSVARTSSEPHRSRRVVDMLRSVWMLRKQYDLAHVDVFSGAAFAWAEAVCLELRALRKPFVLTLRGGELPAFAARWPRRVGRLLRAARCVTAPTRYLAHGLREHGARLETIPNAIDVARYPYSVRSPLRPRLVWLRSFHAVYNPVLAVEVLARLPGATLTMIGPDKGDGSRAAVEQRARELAVTDRLTLVGRVDKSDVPSRLADADIFLNTTNADNTPVSVIEAMACGLCVVSTNVGGLPYLLEDRRDALLVPPRDPAVMASAVQELLGDVALAGRISTAAHARAAKHDWSSVITTWERVFTSAATNA